ncbi:uncharacterized protein AB9X84_009365 isoform 2-T6 [Acanthopagrus schlegelii]
MSTNSSSKTNKCCLQSTVLQFSKSESPVTMCGGSCEIWRTLNLERSQRKIQMMAAQKQRITANSITGRHHDGRCQIKYVFHCLDRKPSHPGSTQMDHAASVTCLRVSGRPCSSTCGTDCAAVRNAERKTCVLWRSTSGLHQPHQLRPGV